MSIAINHKQLAEEYDQRERHELQRRMDAAEAKLAALLQQQVRKDRRQNLLRAIGRTCFYFGLFFMSGYVVYWALGFLGHLLQAAGVRITGLFQ